MDLKQFWRENVLHQGTVNTQNKTPHLNPGVAVGTQAARRLTRNGYDPLFLSRVQSQGGLVFDDGMVQTGDGYSACLCVIKYPEDPMELWGTSLVLNDSTVTTIDVATDSMRKIKGQINRSLQELGDRAMNGRKATDMNDANKDYQDLLTYSAELSQQGEIPKKVLTRIFVYAPTIESLQEKVANLKAALKGQDFEASNYLFFQPDQYKSMTQSLHQQERNFNMVPAEQPMPAFTFGISDPFSFQELKDPRGLPIGRTTSGGSFWFDQFRSTQIRRSFNMMVLGKMGMGKSTLLKLLTKGCFARNMYWRGIDKTREYINLVHALDGIVVSLDGSEGMINPLEVMATSVDEKTGRVDELTSFLQHKSKVKTMFNIMNPDFTKTEMNDFETMLTSFYVSLGMLPKDWTLPKYRFNLGITGRDPKDYPTMSQFAAFVDKLNDDKYLDAIGATPERRRTFEKIKIGLHAMIEGNGPIFDGHSTMRDLSREKIVLFDTSSLAQNDQSVYQAQLFQALTLIWNQALINGRKQNLLVSEKKLDPEFKEYFDVVLDECHNIINYRNMFAVDYIKNFEREMRKFNAGIIFATQSPEEMVPDNAETAELSNLKTVFELCQIKVMFGMDASQIDKIKKLLKGSLADSDYRSIPDLKATFSKWSLGANEKYTVKILATPEELRLFGGGQ